MRIHAGNPNGSERQYPERDCLSGPEQWLRKGYGKGGWPHASG